MIKMKQWFYNTKFFKICKAVLVFLMGALLCCAPLCVSAQNYSPNASYSLVDSSSNFKIEYCVASSLTGSFSWVDQSTLNGYVSYTPLSDSYHYILRCSNNNYCSGIRIYGCLLGPSGENYIQNFTVSFSGISYDTLNYTVPDVSSVNMTQAYLNDFLGKYFTYSETVCGVSDYNEAEKYYTASVSVGHMPVTNYDINDTTYTYNHYTELTFTPISMSGFDFGFWLDFYTDTEIPNTPFLDFLESMQDGALYLKTLATKPTFPISDFLNGTRLNQFLGNNLTACINPFTSLFFSGSMNSTWLGFVYLSFGMFVLYFLLAVLRRVKK